MNIQAKRRAKAMAEQWSTDFASVMQAMGDFCPTMKVRLLPPVRTSDMLWWDQPLNLATGAGIWIGAPAETWSVLGKGILAVAGIDSSGPTEQKDTYLEVLRQSLGVLARGTGIRLGRHITATNGTEQEPAGDPAFGCQITISTGDEALPSLAFFLNRETLEALQSAQSDSPDSSQSSRATPDDKQNGDEISPRACGTLDLLLDVEMPVSISFGRTQVRVQDILKLITGSIIELDRGISEPVEVVINNCTIARGEVVVLDGNYGIRIHEVMSRRERLQESRKYLLPASSNRH